jgi:hypothetical protein
MYWQGDFVSDVPFNDPPHRPSREGSILHVLKQPILGLSLTPKSANTLAEIGDKFKDGCAVVLLFVPSIFLFALLICVLCCARRSAAVWSYTLPCRCAVIPHSMIKLKVTHAASAAPPIIRLYNTHFFARQHALNLLRPSTIFLRPTPTTGQRRRCRARSSARRRRLEQSSCARHLSPSFVLSPPNPQAVLAVLMSPLSC